MWGCFGRLFRFRGRGLGSRVCARRRLQGQISYPCEGFAEHRFRAISRGASESPKGFGYLSKP